MSELIKHGASGKVFASADLLLEHQRLFTAEEFEAMLERGLFAGEHVELIQGRLTTLLAQGPRHVSHVDWLSTLFSERLAEAFGPRQRRVTVRVQSTSRFEATATSQGDRTTPEADLMLVQTGKALSGQALAPNDVFLVVEVADTSLEKDLTEKSRVYAALGVPCSGCWTSHTDASTSSASPTPSPCATRRPGRSRPATSASAPCPN